ncbi:sodium:solute symporter [Candidatus Neomarinimicrobiota bacterium]
MIYVYAISVYLAILIGIGVYKSRNVKTQDDFMVAGRKTSTFILVTTLVCTWIGSGSLFGGAGLAFREGFSMLWFSAGAWVGIIIVYFIAHRVRRIAQYTINDILEKRYNASARLLGTTVVIIAYLTIAGYQFRGGGRLLNLLIGIDPVVGAAWTCAFVILFTVTAGMVSIMSIDMFNGIVMSIGVVIAVPLAFNAVGGAEQFAMLPASHTTIFGDNNFIWVLGVFFPTFFLLLGESSIYQKIFSAKNEAAARKAVFWMIIGVVVLETLLAVLSVVGASKYLTLAPFVGSNGLLDNAQTETILLYLARFELPQIAGVIMFCGAVAIILSTANTFLMVPSTNITRDIYQRFINPEVSETKIVKFQRIMIVVLGITAFIVANFFETILEMAFTAYAMVGAGITPALLAAFLWKRVTVAGGVASIASGLGVTLLITIFNIVLPEPLISTDYIILPAAGASIFSLIVVSLLTPHSPEKKWRPFVDTGK